jgi:hypothetical protein
MGLPFEAPELAVARALPDGEDGWLGAGFGARDGGSGAAAGERSV